jgi:hypothetical protein
MTGPYRTPGETPETKEYTVKIHVVGGTFYHFKIKSMHAEDALNKILDIIKKEDGEIVKLCHYIAIRKKIIEGIDISRE